MGKIYPLLQILGDRESEGGGDWMVTPQGYLEKKGSERGVPGLKYNKVTIY